jgi:integrase
VRPVLSALALELLILTATRTGEVIEANWSEFDLDTKVWTIPAERMKAGKEHRVPLNTRAMEILEHLKTIRVNSYLRISAHRDRPFQVNDRSFQSERDRPFQSERDRF